MTADLQPQNGEAAVRVVEGDTLNDAGESFALVRLLAAIWPGRRQELGWIDEGGPCADSITIRDAVGRAPPGNLSVHGMGQCYTCKCGYV